MVEWTDDAVRAAFLEDGWVDKPSSYPPMRRILDAAAKVQGLGDSRLYKDGYAYAKGRAEAFEEAISFGEELAQDAFYADSDSVLEQMRKKFLGGA